MISAQGYRAQFDDFERIGALLISTLTTLKHAGAAFAARDSLQVVVAVAMGAAYDERIRELPTGWAKRLIAEISTSDKVRDSTLRRSTGYGLGFLAIMRSELSRKQGPPKISNHIIDTLLSLSLPPEERIKLMFQHFNLNDTQADVSSFFQLSTGQGSSFLSDAKYEVSLRIGQSIKYTVWILTPNKGSWSCARAKRPAIDHSRCPTRVCGVTDGRICDGIRDPWLR